jgi:hypothetical protein
MTVKPAHDTGLLGRINLFLHDCCSRYTKLQYQFKKIINFSLSKNKLTLRSSGLAEARTGVLESGGF